eukprot:GHUV01035380.1.p2 GENE.GHUV01035380.1~~GHUV01035380.1.p2  ORF type:complete len:116 (+),score=15.51 GHUV01035380.1:304-651(+)
MLHLVGCQTGLANAKSDPDGSCRHHIFKSCVLHSGNIHNSTPPVLAQQGLQSAVRTTMRYILYANAWPGLHVHHHNEAVGASRVDTDVSPFYGVSLSSLHSHESTEVLKPLVTLE